MSNIEKLKELYERKALDGLVDVRFDLKDAAKNASLEDIAGEILAMQAAIDAGKTRPLDFGDFLWRKGTGTETMAREVLQEAKVIPDALVQDLIDTNNEFFGKPTM